MIKIECYHRRSKHIAVQVTFDNMHEVARWCHGAVVRLGIEDHVEDVDPSIILSTVDGAVFAENGSYVVKNPKHGRFEVLSEEEFYKKFKDIQCLIPQTYTQS